MTFLRTHSIYSPLQSTPFPTKWVSRFIFHIVSFEYCSFESLQRKISRSKIKNKLIIHLLSHSSSIQIELFDFTQCWTRLSNFQLVIENIVSLVRSSGSAYPQCIGVMRVCLLRAQKRESISNVLGIRDIVCWSGVEKVGWKNPNGVNSSEIPFYLSFLVTLSVWISPKRAGSGRNLQSSSK